MARRPKVFTWHIHGSYLYYLTQAACDFYVPKGPGEGYGGRAGNFPWGDNVIEVPMDEAKNLPLDCIIFQSRKNYEADQYEILSEKQRRRPKIYLEHDPPREHPTDTKHPVDDPNMLLVHVTTFNNLMWDNNRTPTTVIDQGVIIPPGVHYSGEKARGIVVVNNIKKRGRRLGWDVFDRMRSKVPLDLVGMGATELGGLGEIPHEALPAFASHYRFFCNPIRYTSLGLAVCEAMMSGLPVVGLATTEMATTIQNGVTGYVSNDPDELANYMQLLLDNPKLAATLGQHARDYARERFNILRFTKDWEKNIAGI